MEIFNWITKFINRETQVIIAIMIAGAMLFWGFDLLRDSLVDIEDEVTDISDELVDIAETQEDQQEDIDDLSDQIVEYSKQEQINLLLVCSDPILYETDVCKQIRRERIR